MSTFIEKDTIEYAVYNITQSSGQDKATQTMYPVLKPFFIIL